MKRLASGSTILAACCLVATTAGQARHAAGQAAAPDRPSRAPAADGSNALIREYFVACHNDRARTGGLSLASFDAAGAADHADVSEKIVRKLRTGLMPPPGARQPAPGVLAALAASLETRIDAAAAAHPNPGRRGFQRLN